MITVERASQILENYALVLAQQPWVLQAELASDSSTVVGVTVEDNVFFSVSFKGFGDGPVTVERAGKRPKYFFNVQDFVNFWNLPELEEFVLTPGGTTSEDGKVYARDLELLVFDTLAPQTSDLYGPVYVDDHWSETFGQFCPLEYEFPNNWYGPGGVEDWSFIFSSKDYSLLENHVPCKLLFDDILFTIWETPEDSPYYKHFGKYFLTETGFFPKLYSNPADQNFVEARTSMFFDEPQIGSMILEFFRQRASNEDYLEFLKRRGKMSTSPVYIQIIETGPCRIKTPIIYNEVFYREYQGEKILIPIKVSLAESSGDLQADYMLVTHVDELIARRKKEKLQKALEEAGLDKEFTLVSGYDTDSNELVALEDFVLQRK